MYYEYDEEKNRSNTAKHGISFDEAISVFFDPMLEIGQDSFEGEERFFAIGRSEAHRDLIVIHCYRIRNNDEYIRIILARKLTRKERLRYEKARL